MYVNHYAKRVENNNPWKIPHPPPPKKRNFLTKNRHFGNNSQTNKRWQKIILFVFLPTKRGLSLLTCYSMQCPEHCPLNRTNQRFFLSESSTLQLISSYAPKRSLTIKKNATFENFREFKSFFWRILDISKEILDFFFGKFRKEFYAIFQELCS